MTKKHYEAIATILKGRDTMTHRETIIKKLADYFASDNPKFNRTRFLEACGIKE